MTEHNAANNPRLPDLALSATETAWLAEHIATADAQNAEIGVTGPEVAAYNLREGYLRLAERRLLDANVLCRRLQRDHEDHPVTRKIWAWQRKKRLGEHGYVDMDNEDL
jgi:hypothetical protein